MRQPQLLYDGLWRCLCPSFNEAALPRALNASLARPRPPNRPFNAVMQRRRIGTESHSDYPPDKGQSLADFFRLAETQIKKAETKDDYLKILGLKKPNLTTVSADDILKALRYIRDGNYYKIPDAHDRIVQFVNFIILKRGYKPDAFLYECMMDAMADPKGSAAGVRKLLTDMAEQGIAPTADVCYGALAALAVHPDYMLRETVVSLMKTYWHEMTTAAKQDIAVGALRDGQHELALAKFTEMHEAREKMDLWVYDVFVVEFGRAGYLDEMLQLLRQRKHAKGTDGAYRTLLFHALDVFSSACHDEGTGFVWEYVVTHRILNPPNATVENVLCTAARNANTTLASQALDVLSSRGKVSTHHYEALVDAFAAAGDVVGAFGVLDIMERSGVGVRRGTTRSVHAAMRKNPWLVTEANDALRKMGETQSVPLQAIAVTVEAMAKVGGAEAAMGLYHDTFALSGKQPDFDMLRQLVLACGDEEDEAVWSLAKDYGVMVAAAAADGPATAEEVSVYERMIPACARQGDFDRAFELAGRMVRAGGEWQAHEWVIPLVEMGVKAKDERVRPIVEGMTKREEGGVLG